MHFTSQKRLELVSDIIRDLKNGVPPWHCPWDHHFPSNHLTNKSYNGINILILWRAASRNQWDCSRFLTFKQVKRMGGSISKGERGTRIFYFDLVDVLDEEGKVEHVRPIYKSSIVYNVAQTNLDYEQPSLARDANHKDVSVLRDTLKYLNIPLFEQGNEAYYHWGRDCIVMPKLGQFHSMGDYLATAWHEVIHATGHELRCGRGFGTASRESSGYALEELVAEIGSKMLGVRLGFKPGRYSSHESYIKHYIELLKGNYNMLFKAASLASTAVSYIVDHADLRADAV